MPNGSEIIVPGDNKHSWNRGHISPDADFVMDYQQDATYYFINIAPQFGKKNSKSILARLQLFPDCKLTWDCRTNLAQLHNV